jgi:hypothetical protein
VTSGQRDGVAGVVVRPPGFVFVDRSVQPEGPGSPGGCLLVGHGSGRHGVEQHVESPFSDPTIEIKVLEPEEPLGVGDNASVEDRS